jgi:hypothetical protein
MHSPLMPYQLTTLETVVQVRVEMPMERERKQALRQRQGCNNRSLFQLNLSRWVPDLTCIILVRYYC